MHIITTHAGRWPVSSHWSDFPQNRLFGLDFYKDDMLPCFLEDHTNLQQKCILATYSIISKVEYYISHYGKKTRSKITLNIISKQIFRSSVHRPSSLPQQDPAIAMLMRLKNVVILIFCCTYISLCGEGGVGWFLMPPFSSFLYFVAEDLVAGVSPCCQVVAVEPPGKQLAASLNAKEIISRQR
jgi:hypothetical protein